MRIGVDLLGADSAPEVIVDGVIAAAHQLPLCRFFLFGTCKNPPLHPQIEYVSTSSCITMHDAPLPAVKEKQTSSLVLGVKALGTKKLDAFITCGNTGAFLVASALYIPRFHRHVRPCLLCEFPSRGGKMAVLDVGGNLGLRAEWLVQFAFMGASYIESYYGKRHLQEPRKSNVALLNIGTESGKGTGEEKKAYKWLSTANLPFNFVGNVEGKDLFLHDIDVLVTSGFSGNIFLKTAEGVAQFLVDWMVNEFQKSGVEGYEKVVRGAKAKFSDTSYQGALLAGVNGVALKCHGKASLEAITAACLGADMLIRRNVVPQMGAILRKLTIPGHV